jgi:hypothetical protein
MASLLFLPASMQAPQWTVDRAEDQAANRQLLKLAAGQAPWIVVVRPYHWARLASDRGALSRVLGALPGGWSRTPNDALASDHCLAGAHLGCVVRHDNAWSGLAGFFYAQPASNQTGPLDGWDDTRPLIAALFEPAIEDLTGSGRLLFSADFRDRPLFRHRLIIPSQTVGRLLQSLRSLYRDLRPISDDAFPAGAFAAPGALLGLAPGTDYVRVEMVTLQKAEQGPEEIPKWMQNLNHYQDNDNSVIEPSDPDPLRPKEPSIAMLQALRMPVATSTIRETPASNRLLQGSDPLALYVRPQRIAAQAMTGHLQNMADMPRWKSTGRKWTDQAMGWARLLRTYVIFSPDEQQVDDAIFVVPDARHIGGILDLKQPALRNVQQARAHALPPLLRAEGSTSFRDVRVALDFSMLLNKTLPSLPPHGEPSRREGDDASFADLIAADHWLTFPNHWLESQLHHATRHCSLTDAGMLFEPKALLFSVFPDRWPPNRTHSPKKQIFGSFPRFIQLPPSAFHLSFPR